MSESIYKLQPNRTIHLRGYDDRGAAAALYATSPTGFTVSGVFRDAADFAVLIIWDADDFFEHPRMKYLPDFDFTGMVLQFDVSYNKLQPLDSQKFPTIDWAYLDVIRPDSTTAQIPLFENAALVGGTYTAATGTFTIEASSPVAGNRLTIWYLNNAFDYIAVGGETASQVASALAAQVNAIDWTTQAPLAALWAQAANEELTFTYARYGHVRTAGKTVTQTAGQNFVGLSAGDPILIGGVETTVTSFDGATSITVANDMGVQTSTPYLAQRGGYDGNMVRLYVIATSAGLTTVESVVQLSAGSSDATWRVTLDFTALSIPSIRQAFLTFAPRLADSAPYAAEEWDAVFTNWAVVADPNGKKPSQRCRSEFGADRGDGLGLRLLGGELGIGGGVLLAGVRKPGVHSGRLRFTHLQLFAGP